MSIMKTDCNILKYNIKEKLGQIPKSKYSEILDSFWSNGINQSTFYSWLRININNKKSIPADSLKIIASVLNCTMEELYNEVPVNG